MEDCDFQWRKQQQSPELCNWGILRGAENLPGVVFPGDEKNEPNILFRQNEFDQHCKICSQKKFCTEEIRKEILKIFEKDKKRFKKFLAPV